MLPKMLITEKHVIIFRDIINKMTLIMNNSYKYFIIFLSLFFVININYKSLIAQDCTETLQEARNMYTEGDIATIPDLLDACIKNGFSKEEKVQAYKLIIQVYIFEDKIEESEQILLKLKKTNPVYQIDYENDGAEFIDLFKQYQTTAFLTIGGFGGFNFPIIQIIERVPTSDLNSYKPEYKGSGTNFQGGLRILYQPYLNIEVQFDPFFMKSSFTYTSQIVSIEDTDQDDPAFYLYNHEFIETINLIHFPLSVVYNYPINNIVPYASAGFDLTLLSNATSAPARNYDVSGFTNVTGSDILLKTLNHRNMLTKNLILGLGVKLKRPMFYIFLDMRHHFALDNIVNGSNRFSNNELIFKYHHVDDDIKMYNLMISVGVAYSFYTHKKK